MNIAILIGVSKYKSEAQLPACAHDVENMERLLIATNKYDDILCIKEQTNSDQLKNKLRNFFKKHQNTTGISEALIYFSGHGVYQNDALLCCSDYDSNRPATTSISNAELDDLLRSVNPDVAVKIIDACQSGSPYIKDVNTGFEKSLSESRLKSFILMASSRQDQSSFASSIESIFTANWIDAALGKQDGNILYRDIQAALADAFVTHAEQTPFFVNQCTGLETFSKITSEMLTLASQRSKTTAPQKPDDAIIKLVETEVSKLDGQYVPYEDIISALEQSKTQFTKQTITDVLVAKFYEKSVSTDLKLCHIPKQDAVAKFADEQSWQKKYFTKINFEQYKARVLKGNKFTTLLGIFTEHGDDEYTTVTKSRPSTLESTDLLPFEVLELSLISTHPSLKQFKIYIGIVHSQTNVMLLSSLVPFIYKGWSERIPELSEVQWRYQNYAWFSIVQDPAALWRDTIERGEADIRIYLESFIPKIEDSLPSIEDELSIE